MNTKYQPPKFTIIRAHNTPNVAEYAGIRVFRKEKLFVPEWGRFVLVAPDSDHFIFETPKELAQDSSYRCTCGSPAVITGSNAYKEWGSSTPTGEMFICLVYATYGKHSDMGSRWI